MHNCRNTNKNKKGWQQSHQVPRQLFLFFDDLDEGEEEMRDLNEATNGRVAWFSILSLGVCIFMAVFQVAYLRKFFKRKKVL